MPLERRLIPVPKEYLFRTEEVAGAESEAEREQKPEPKLEIIICEQEFRAAFQNILETEVAALWLYLAEINDWLYYRARSPEMVTKEQLQQNITTIWKSFQQSLQAISTTFAPDGTGLGERRRKQYPKLPEIVARLEHAWQLVKRFQNVKLDWNYPTDAMRELSQAFSMLHMFGQQIQTNISRYSGLEQFNTWSMELFQDEEE